MSEHSDYEAGSYVGEDRVPGEPLAEARTLKDEVRGYILGLVIATALTAASFWAVGSDMIYREGAAVALLVLAVAQMGIHLVFFLHITTSPDNANNVLALAFGVLIVFLVVFGSLWVMGHMNHNMVSMEQLMQMQR
jgi:cytochrome o ubiquinol oxidase subunit IV